MPRTAEYRPGDLSRRLADLDALQRAARGQVTYVYEPEEHPPSWLDMGAGVLGGLVIAVLIVIGIGVLLAG